MKACRLYGIVSILTIIVGCGGGGSHSPTSGDLKGDQSRVEVLRSMTPETWQEAITVLPQQVNHKFVIVDRLETNNHNQIMIYLPEDYYFWNNQDFPFKKAILITVKTVVRWCDSYEARILEPKKGVKIKHKSGNLPKNINDKEKIVEDVLNWIWDNSKDQHYFRLYIKKNKTDIFTYHDSSFWGLELSENKFKELQKLLKKDCLPEDLFFKKGQAVIAIPKHYKKWSKLRRILFGTTHAFSPKTWGKMKKYGKDRNYIIQNNPV